MAVPTQADLETMAQRMTDGLMTVPGVVGVVLGGSRARGDHRPDSDVDLGLYATAELDRALLSSLARVWSGSAAAVGPAGSWGPWVDSGTWLDVDGQAVDWIVRDVRRVAAVCDAVLRGEHGFHAQPGHPLGFWDAAYAGELASAVILADPDSHLRDLRARLTPYPPALRASVINGLWEADLLLAGARKSAARADIAHVLLCLTRALALAAHALHAHAGVWVTNEKGLIPAVARLPRPTADFAERASALLATLGSSPTDLAAGLDVAAVLLADCRASLGSSDDD